MFYLMTHSTHNIVKDHSHSEIGNPLPPQLAARVLLHASSHRQDNTYQSWSTSWNELSESTRGIDPTTHRTVSERSYHEATFRSPTGREREMFYLTTHSTHFYLRLYGVRHMVKDHSDSEKGNPLPPYMLLLSINSKGSFICTIPQTE